MFVYPLLGCFGYGSQSWVDGMDEKPRDLREVKPLAEVLTIAQIEADRVGQTMSVFRTPEGDHQIAQGIIVGATLVVPITKKDKANVPQDDQG